MEEESGKLGQSRLHQIIAQSEGNGRKVAKICELPNIECGEYLVAAWVKLGMASRSGEEEVAITWAEVGWFSHCTGAIEEPWELDLMVEMSKAYLNWKFKGRDPLCIPPIEFESAQDD